MESVGPHIRIPAVAERQVSRLEDILRMGEAIVGMSS
jgi:hypothetical protein